MSRALIVEADLTWTGERFESGMKISINSSGRIDAVGAMDAEATDRLTGKAVLPGFVNAHSHSFQRGLRGRGERFPKGSGSFWSWREAMYGLAERISPDEFYSLNVAAYREMLRRGITTVGEFHYFHHASGHDFALDDAILAAARESGIRLVLLETCYQTGAIGQPLAERQRRFATEDIDSFWTQVDHLVSAADPGTQTIGAVAHSIRAVPLAAIVQLHEEALRRKIPFHMHVEEQRREVEECVAAYGAAPMRLLNDNLEIGPLFTAVHCTHSAPPDLERFCQAGGNVCITPLTEGNLGDGFGPTEILRRDHVSLSLGTDSNARISMLEEMRWLEYSHRLATGTRGVFVGSDATASAGGRVLAAATEGGARSLGIEAGAIRGGMFADLAVIDLSAPELDGWRADTLVDSLAFGCGDEVIVRTMVGGEWR